MDLEVVALMARLEGSITVKSQRYIESINLDMSLRHRPVLAEKIRKLLASTYHLAYCEGYVEGSREIGDVTDDELEEWEREFDE